MGKKSNVKRMTAFLMAASMIMTGFSSPAMTARAATKKYVKSLKVSKSNVKLRSGAKLKVKATVKVVKKAKKNVKVVSSNKKVITAKVGKPNAKGVSTITLTAKKVTAKKTAVIKVTTAAKNKKNKKITKKIKVTVTPTNGTGGQPTPGSPDNNGGTGTNTPTSDPGSSVTSVTADIQDAEIGIGGTTRINVVILPAGSNQKATFTSGDTSVATVDPTGIVTGIGTGTTTITVSAGGKMDTVTITVRKINPESIALTSGDEVSMDIGETKKLTVAFTPNTNMVDKSLTWTSTSPEVAAVDTNGVITAISQGKTTITAITVNGKKASCIIHVREKVVVPDGLTMSVSGALKDNDGDIYNTNTTLVGQDLKVEVKAVKDEKPFEDQTITLNMERIAGSSDGSEPFDPYVIRGDGNATGRYKQTAKTDKNGVASFDITVDPNRKVDPFSFDYVSYKLQATVNISDFPSNTDPVSVSFAALAMDNVNVLNGHLKDDESGVYPDVEPSDGANWRNNGIAATTLENDGSDDGYDYKVDYVTSQKYSGTEEGEDHRVYISSTPLLLIPYSGTATSNTYENIIDTEHNSTGTVTNYDKSRVITSPLRTGTTKLDIEFDKLSISDYTKLYFTIADEDGDTYSLIRDGQIFYDGLTTEDIQNELHDNTITLNLSREMDKNGIITITLASKGMVNASHEGCVIKKITGTTSKNLSGYFETINMNNAFQWSEVKKSSLKNPTKKKLASVAEAKKYLPLPAQDNEYTNWTFECEWPTAPAVGNALIKVTTASGTVSYYSYPTYYSKDDMANVLADREHSRNGHYGPNYAIPCTLDEYDNQVGRITGVDGNVVIVDSANVGTTYLKGTLSLTGLQGLDLAGKEIYTAIQWAPLNYADKEEKESTFFAVQDSDVVLKFALKDKSNIAATGTVNLDWDTRDGVTESGNTELPRTITVSETDGTAILRLKGKDAAYIQGLTAKSANTNFKCYLYVKDHEVGYSLQDDVVKANIYWVDLGLAFGDKEDNTAWYHEYSTTEKKVVSAGQPVGTARVGSNKWLLQCLPIGKSLLFEWSGRELAEDEVGINRFISASNIPVTYKVMDNDPCTLISEKNAAIISSRKTGMTELQAVMDLSGDLSKVVFTYYDDKGEIQTAENVGENIGNSLFNSSMRLYFRWINDEDINLTMKMPLDLQIVPAGEDTIVYLQALDGQGNPIANEGLDEGSLKNAAYTLDEDGNEIKMTDANGILPLKVSGTGTKNQTTKTVSAAMNNVPVSLELAYRDRDTEQGLQSAVATDAHTVKLTFSKEIKCDKGLAKLFDVRENGSSLGVSNILVGSNTITLTTVQTMIFTDQNKQTITLAPARDSLERVHHVYGASDGQIIEGTYEIKQP